MANTVQIGDVFDRWTVIRHGYDKRHVVCKCSCGTEKIVNVYHLKSGASSSCGCRRSEVTYQRNYKHGHSPRSGVSSTYVSWAGMIARCTNPNDSHWMSYGGRGIFVCQRWLDSFQNFLADMGEKPEGLSIDRIDNDEGYEPDNCRWATDEEQRSNKRRKHTVFMGMRSLVTMRLFSQTAGGIAENALGVGLVDIEL